MAVSSSVAIPIIPYRVVDTQGAQATMRRYLEKATQTFKIGTPVQIDVAGATGYLIACPSMVSVATAHVLGFSAEVGHNLSSSGVGKVLNQGAPQNQASAVIIPGGAWPSDGTSGVHVATDIDEFIGVLGNSADNSLAITAITMLQTVTYGLTIDPGNSYWYVDQNKTSAAGGACVSIVGFVDPIGTLNGKVIFRVLRAAQQYNLIAA